MSEPRLAVRLKTRTFSRKEAEKLGSYLQHVDEGTLVVPIDSSKQLMLDQHYRTLDHQNRYTVPALLQVSQLLSPGLGRFLLNLSGEDPHPSGEFRPQLAVATLNRVLELRFGYSSGLRSRQLVCHAGSQLIEGLVGLRYCYLSNREFFNLIGSTLASDTFGTRFFQASIYGRKLSLIYLSPRPAFSLSFGDRAVEHFHAGYHFTNSEVGDSSVWAETVLYRKSAGTFCLGGLSKHNRQRHSGKDFAKKLEKLVQKVVVELHGLDKIRKEAQRHGSVSLRIPSLDGTDRQRRKKELASRLRQRGLSLQQAQKLVMSTIYSGSDPLQPWMRPSPAEIASRTQFDLAASLMAEALTHSLDGRSRLERLAFDILTGRFTL